MVVIWHVHVVGVFPAILVIVIVIGEVAFVDSQLFEAFAQFLGSRVYLSLGDCRCKDGLPLACLHSELAGLVGILLLALVKGDPAVINFMLFFKAFLLLWHSGGAKLRSKMML